MSLELVFLGTGTSAGVPMIGCDCPVCTSDDPRDRRSRPSVLIRYPRPRKSNPRPRKLNPCPRKDDARPPEVDTPTARGTSSPPMAMSGLPTPISDPQSLTPKPAPWDDPQVAAGGAAGADEERVCQFLIDTTPELRVQAIARRMNYVDGVFFTHAHADHVTGLDDLRRFNAVMDKAIPIYADRATLDRLAQMFTYIFEPGRNVNPTFIPNLIPHALEAGQEVELEGAKWTALSLRHGRLPVLGFRVDFAGQAVAYCTDVSSIPPETYPLLENLDVLVIDALRYRHHPTHLTVEQALHEVDQIKPKRAYFTHIAHDICHAELQEKLPAGVFLGYDGLNVIC